MKFARLAALVFAGLFFFSCKTSAKKNGDEGIRLLFAGDIMAHTQNFLMGNYNDIWEDIKPLVLQSDLSFANLESPVVEEKPFESYPTFNMKGSYPKAAFDAGFNLISLANNHTHDQGPEGISATQKWAERVSATRPVYFSGIVKDGQWSHAEIKLGQTKILFLAATELINTWSHYSLVNFIQPSKKGRADFVQRVFAMKEKFLPDLFIVSVHTSEEEYVSTVKDSVRDFYHQVLDAGCDILVSNHPHVVRPVEWFGEKKSGKIRKAIMYANGNTISGQRRALNYENPGDTWQATGDGQLVIMDLRKDEEGPYIFERDIKFITTYTPQGAKSPVVKILDDDFIHGLEKSGQKKDARYYAFRLDSLKKIQGKTIWQ